MKNKITEYKNLVVDFALRLRDVRFVGQLLFVVVVLLISWSGIKTIQTNYGLQKQIATIQQQNVVQQLENNNLKLQNEYYDTNQYLELSARQNFGLANDGEKEILVPASVALSYAPDLGQASTVQQPVSHQPVYQRHFQSWVNFFLHRQESTN
jgi:cell division protein FtsL